VTGPIAISGPPQLANGFRTAHAARLRASYRCWTGGELLDPRLDATAFARALWEAPLVVASHGTEPDPVFNYGNRAALALFETTWERFTAMPSRLSAEAPARGERAALLARVTTNGYIADYSGIRVTTTGRRFRIRRATVWNVLDETGRAAGQAVAFGEWEWL
jgi:hypothetical protein